MRVKTNRERREVVLDISDWGAGLAVTGRTRNIEQNILQTPQYTNDPSAQMRTR